MPDGTLIQWGNFTETLVANGYKEHTLTYPISFVGVPGLSVIPTIWSDPSRFSVCQRGGFQSSGILRLGNAGSDTPEVTYVWTAVGRWK